MATLRIGLVGASRVATFAMIEPARDIDGVEIVAIAARDVGRARLYAEQNGIARVHDSYEALVSDAEVDLVYVGTPPHLHLHQALMAIEAGKPVLVEKPITMTSAEARQLFEAAARAGTVVFEAMHSPHHALFWRILHFVHAGQLGTIERLEAEFSVPIGRDPKEFRWRAECGGGALMDLGVYPLAWCRRIAGDAFVVEEAKARRNGGVDEWFSASLRFATGPMALIRSSMVAAFPTARLTVEGTRGRLEAVNPLSPQMGHSLRIEIDGQVDVETVPGPSSFAAQLAAVRACLVDGQTFPFPTEDYVRSMSAIEQIRAAFTPSRDS